MALDTPDFLKIIRCQLSGKIAHHFFLTICTTSDSGRMENSMKRAWSYLICMVLILSGYIYSNTLKPEPLDSISETMARGEVLEMKELLDDTQNLGQLPGTDSKVWEVEVQIKSGLFKNEIITATHYYGNNLAYDFIFTQGDEVILSLEVDDGVLNEAYISDLSRDKYSRYLLAVFLILILLIGGRQGIDTILSLFITGLAVVGILIPAILTGKDPIFSTIIICTGTAIA
jgi:uncharacterized membrane protein